MTAKSISGKKSYLEINKSIQSVELQICCSVDKQMVELVYSKRKRDPKIWNQIYCGDVKLEDLFRQAKELATRDAENETDNIDAKNKYITTHGNCVGVSGQAGIGKTTLTKQLVKKVLDENMLDIDFLFYVSLNKVNYNDKMSVLQFLLTNLDSHWEHDRDSDNEILKQLDEMEKVMIIFDGLDEAKITLEEISPNTKLDEVTTPEALLKNFFLGNILPKAKKLITSRPRQMLELHEYCRPHFKVNVIGINLEAQKQICDDICGGESKKVYDELVNHPELLAQCYIPIICIFTAYYLYQRLVYPEQTASFPSVTNITLNVIQTFARHGILKSELDLEKLSKLAWEKIRCKKYEFSEKEIINSGLKKGNLNALFSIKTKGSARLRILSGEKIIYFSHLILQEFFSAVWLILFQPLSHFEEEATTACALSDVVKTFLFGLCNETTYEHLTNLLPSSYDDSDFKTKKSFLEQSIFGMARDMSSISNSFSKCLEICSLLYEMNNLELTKKNAELFPDSLHFIGRVFPHDVDSLCNVLKERKKPLALNFDGINFIGDSCQRFFRKFSKMRGNVVVSIHKFK